MMTDWDAHETLSAIAMHAIISASGDGMGAELIARRAYEIAEAMVVENHRRKNFPQCSGDPASCPENEGHGCCKPNPSKGKDNYATHKPRYSDSSLYDEVCTVCGARVGVVAPAAEAICVIPGPHSGT